MRFLSLSGGSRERATRPVFRYFGGKWRLAAWIISHFPAHTVYTEAFGGAASVLIQKPRARVEIYNDIDGEVVHVFRVLRDPQLWPELQRRMRCMPYAREEFDCRFDEPYDAVDRALRCLARSRMGFGANALYEDSTSFRVRRDDRSTPAHEWAALWRDIAPFAKRFAGVTIEQCDAVEVLERHDGKTTLHYVDPPYALETRGARNRYMYEMSDEDHERLAHALHDLRGMVVLSGYDCDLYRELFAGWTRVERTHLADGANRRVESLWLSPATVKALQCDLFTREAS